MTAEKAFFLRVLSDHLSGRATGPAEGLDWEVLCRLSRSHQVDGIVYYQCKDFVPADMRAVFERAFSATIYYCTNRSALMNEIASALRGKRMFFFTVKGFTVAQHYPLPMLRTMGDCDIVLHRDDIPQAAAMLVGMGFHGSDTVSVQQWGCDKDGLHFEIHDRLVQEGEYATAAQAGFFNDYDRYVTDGVLDSSFHFLFLLMHLRKHFLNRGVGIRQFMDLAVMIRNNPDLRWDWIEESLQRLELRKFAHVCFALIDKWFGISAPVKADPLPDSLTEKIAGKTLDGGVFGYQDEQNRFSDARTALIQGGGPLWLRRMKVLLSKTFLSYENMRGYAGCGFLDGRPYLLPFAWLKRLGMILRRKDKTATIRTIRSSMIPAAELKERDRLLRDMGLL